MKYITEDKADLIILAGEQYGSGRYYVLLYDCSFRVLTLSSSHDWAAKGVWMQGVKVVIATSYERIHRSNLVLFGVVPLEVDML